MAAASSSSAAAAAAAAAAAVAAAVAAVNLVLECNNPTLLELRGKYVSPYYTSQPSMEKLAELINNRGKKLFKLARYVNEGLKIY